MAPRTTSNRLYIGIGGCAVALDRNSGEEIWRTKLKSTSYVTVWATGDRVFAGAGGELFCLDATGGEIVWRNKLKGLGMGLISFATGADAVAAAMMAQQQAAAAAASA